MNLELLKVRRISNYAIDLFAAANHLIGTPARIDGCHVMRHDPAQTVWAPIERKPRGFLMSSVRLCTTDTDLIRT
jgi:hypothetical protein